MFNSYTIRITIKVRGLLLIGQLAVQSGADVGCLPQDLKAFAEATIYVEVKEV